MLKSALKNSVRLLKRTYAQIAFLWLVYGLLVLVCYIFVSSVLRDLLSRSAEDMLTNLQARTVADLMESETALRGVSLNIRRMLKRGSNVNDVSDYMMEYTDDVLRDRRRTFGGNGLYGVFHIYGDLYLDGAGGRASVEFSGKPWYEAAMDAGGAVASTDAYYSEERGEWVVSFSRSITDKRGNSLAVIALDMPLRALRSYFSGTRIAEGGYGIMADGGYNIILGPVEETIGQPLTALKSPDIDKIINELNEGRNLSGYETVNFRQDGETVVVHSRQIENGWHVAIITPINKYYKNILEQGVTIAVMGALLQLFLTLIVMRIASAKIKADERDKHKSSFLANMSHEIRTPMNAIIGFAELALREDIPPAAYEHIFTIKQAGANLLSIVNDILDFSKIESGKLEILPSNYLFSSLVNDVVSIIKMRATYSRLRFVVNIDCNIPNALYGDEVRVRQVLLNLLSNAVKYTDHGFVSLNVTGERDPASDDVIILTVRVTDSGKGIKKEDIDKLFKDFSQVDKSRNKGIEGTGLGLAITSNILKAMGGSIVVESEYGKGSTFKMRLPQRFTDPEKLANVDDAGSKRVLIYERREVYSSSVIRTVENLGVGYTLVASEFEFDEKLAAASYQFIFTAPALYEAVKKIIVKRGSRAKVALLTEFGEAIADRDVTILSMPVYSITVANMLNGVSVSSDYGAKRESFAKFIAPDAHVLVVDDTSTNLRVAEGLLSPYKMSVTLCKSGHEALDAVQSQSFDLVFMDHMMPGMDGIEAARRIREMGGALARIPIIALTANAVAGAKEMFLAQGFDDFISKPIDIAKLNSVLDRWISVDKRKLPSETNGKNSSDGGPDTAEIKIDGVNVEHGVTLSGGNSAHYLRAVTMFYEDGFEKIEEIKKCLELGDLQLYATHVHGLKSASASIGAVALSAAAQKLETAGKDGNDIFINTHNPPFLMDLETILRNIGKALEKFGPEKKEIAPGITMESLRTELVKLKVALDTFDSATIDSAANTLEMYSQSKDFGASVKAIAQNILIGEYDEAVIAIDALLKETASRDTGAWLI